MHPEPDSRRRPGAPPPGDALAHALARLTRLQRRALSMVYDDGRSQAQAAEQMQVPRRVIARAVADALQAVGRDLERASSEGAVRHRGDVPTGT